MIIKNISNNNINIYNKILKPYETIEIDNIEEVITLLNIGYIEFVNEKEKRYSKERILESFFNFHLNKCTKEDLEIIKTFYSKMFPNVNQDMKDQIREMETAEELIEVLLNSFYPKLINLLEGE